MLKTTASLFVLLATSAIGSAFAHDGPANADELELIKKAKVLVIIEQEKAEAAFEASNVGKDYGLIGMTIDMLDNRSRFRKLNEALVPLQTATADLNFRRDFMAQLKGLKLFNPALVEVIDKTPESKAALLKLIASAGDPVVVIDAHAVLTPGTYRVLAVELALSLWTGGKKKPLHNQGITHLSDPVTLSQTWNIQAVSLPAWADNRGRRYRAAYAEGIAGSIDVLSKTFTFAPPAGSKRVGRVDYTDAAMKPNRYGVVVEETGDRVVIVDGQSTTSIPIVKTLAERQQDIKPAKPAVARVYFYRPGTSDTNFIEPSVYANGSKLGDLYMRTCAYVDLPPGKYSFRVKYDGDSPGAGVARGQIDKIAPVEIEVLTGTEHFVRYDGYKGIWTKEDVLKNIEAATARAELQSLWPIWW